MTRAQLTDLPEYFDRYINLCDDVTPIEALSLSIIELDNAPLADLLALGDRIYAPDKWTIKDVFQHMIDTERVFAYRAMILARGDKEIQSFDENQYADLADTSYRTLENIINEFRLVKMSTSELFKSFDETMMTRRAENRKGDFSPRAIAFMVAGHQKWHMHIINERYMPLLNA